MRERAAGGAPAGFDVGLLKVLAHPVRWRILEALADRAASPVQLSRTLEEPLGNVSYHVRVLLEHGCVVPAGTRPRRGATEHFYRALARPLVGDETWRTLPALLRRQLSGRTVADLLDDAARAARSGGFDGDEVHAIRLLLTLDDAGWSAMSALVAETLDHALAVQAASRDRGAARTRTGEVGLLLFARA